MIKKIITLLVTSSIIAAGLLFLGITVMSQFSPARASTLDALIAEKSVQNSADSIPTLVNNNSAKELNSVKDLQEVSSAQPSVSTSPVVSSQSPTMAVNTNSGETPVTGLTIAELLKNPELYDDLVITITGIATSLNDEKFLLNDGTGQILVEVEDELVSLSIINGLSVTVIGEFDDSSSSIGLEVDACSLSYQDETIIFDDCMDDDDDMDDDSDDMDDDSDDMNDDSDDMDDDSDDMDGDDD